MANTFFGEWLLANPNWVGVFVFIVALLESLAIVGMLVPGAFMIVSIGVMMGLGLVPVYSTMAWAALGAICGDSLSFWLGRHFQHQLLHIWPLNKYPTQLERGIEFFHRYGGRSIFVGRFIGPLRALVPAIAGIFDMPSRRFLLFNVSSGVLWAPAYLLPGMALAHTAEAAGPATTRFLLTLLIVVLLTSYLLIKTYRVGMRHSHRRAILFTSLSVTIPAALAIVWIILTTPPLKQLAHLSIQEGEAIKASEFYRIEAESFEPLSPQQTWRPLDFVNWFNMDAQPSDLPSLTDIASLSLSDDIRFIAEGNTKLRIWQVEGSVIAECLKTRVVHLGLLRIAIEQRNHLGCATFLTSAKLAPIASTTLKNGMSVTLWR